MTIWLKKAKMIPHHSKVLVKLWAKDRDLLFNKTIVRSDGKMVNLAVGYEWNDDRLDASYAQNVSVGEIVGVGDKMKDVVQVGDIGIIDYLVDNDRISLVESNDEYKIMAVWAKCTFHEHDSPKDIYGRYGYYKGDYKRIGQLYGVVRGDNLIAIEPYVFLEHGSNVVNMYNKRGFFGEEKISVVERKVLASYPGAYAQAGETIVIPDTDIFDRMLKDGMVSTIFNIDIKLKKYVKTDILR